MPIYNVSRHNISFECKSASCGCLYLTACRTPPTPLACGATVNRHPYGCHIPRGLRTTPHAVGVRGYGKSASCGCHIPRGLRTTPHAVGVRGYGKSASIRMPLPDGVPRNPHAVGVRATVNRHPYGCLYLTACRRVNWSADALCFRGGLVAEHFRLVPQAGFVEEAAVFIREGYVAVMLLLVHYVLAFCLALRRP